MARWGYATFPARGHEITGWFAYRGMAHSGLLETAFAPEIQAGVIRKIRRDLYHEIGGFWQWTLNPHFDIRLAGNVAVAGDGSRDLAHLADCDPDRPAGPVKVKHGAAGGCPLPGTLLGSAVTLYRDRMLPAPLYEQQAA